MKKDLKYFMRPEQQITVTVPGPETIRDENGEVIELEIRKLSMERIRHINEMYRKRYPAKDGKGKSIIQNGELVFRTDFDNHKAAMHVFVEALVHPDLKDKELMAYYGCNDITEMPGKVFPTNEEFTYVHREILQVLGLLDYEVNEDEELEDAKN